MYTIYTWSLIDSLSKIQFTLSRHVHYSYVYETYIFCTNVIKNRFNTTTQTKEYLGR